MQTIKTMFKSPRFVIGLLLVLIIICYAIFVPVIFTADPKQSRADNPYYDDIQNFIETLKTENDEQISRGIANLREIAANETNAVYADAVNNIGETLDAIETELAVNPVENAIISIDQVKSKRKYALVSVEREGILAALTDGDIDTAKAEGEKIAAHCADAVALYSDISAAGSDFDAVLALIDGSGVTDADKAYLAEAANLRDADKLAEALESFKEQHDKLDMYSKQAIERTSVSSYAKAAEVASITVQKTYLIPKNTPPNSVFWFGTDNFSRDLFLEMAYGARTSLLVGLLAGVIATIIGIGLGLVAGFVGGLVDNIITMVTNTFIVIPSTVILILISIAVGQFREAWLTGVIIGFIAWPWTARAVRAQTTSLRYRDHVNMARITGFSTGRIILTEIMPYLASYVVMAFILQVAGGIGQEATLAMLGLGDPTGISLGRLMNWAINYEAINFNRWWLFIPVACAIAMITYGLYLMNSGMDQVFNPKIRS